MPNPIIKRQVKRIAIGTVVGLLVLLLVYGLYLWRWLPLDRPVRTMPTILAGIDLYKQTYKTYPPTLSALGGAPATCATVATATAACLIDNVLASGEKSGYSYRYKAIDTTQNGRVDAFTLTADPVNGGGPKQRHYFVDQTGVIRIEIGRPATAASPPAD
jgi:hypothetical protein